MMELNMLLVGFIGHNFWYSQGTAVSSPILSFPEVHLYLLLHPEFPFISDGNKIMHSIYALEYSTRACDSNIYKLLVLQYSYFDKFSLGNPWAAIANSKYNLQQGKPCEKTAILFCFLNFPVIKYMPKGFSWYYYSFVGIFDIILCLIEFLMGYFSTRPKIFLLMILF